MKSGYLWTTPPTKNAPYGWLHTDRTDLITVFRTRENSDDIEILADDDPDRKLYFDIYNRQDMVMNRIHAPEKVAEEEKRIGEFIAANNLQTRLSLLSTQQRMIGDGKPG